MLGPDDFDMEMTIDDNGVIVSRIRGMFDSTVWLHRLEAIRVRDFPEVKLAGRPIVCDIRGCQPPEAKWNLHLARVHQTARQRHTVPCRRAIVTDRDLGMEMWIKLFVEHERGDPRNRVESRRFIDFDAAYTWATEAWLAADRGITD